MPLVPTARVTKQAREKANELAAAAFLFLASNTPFGWPFLLLLVLHLLFYGGAVESEANKNVPDGSSRWPTLEQVGRPCSCSAGLPITGAQEPPHSRPFSKY